MNSALATTAGLPGTFSWEFLVYLLGFGAVTIIFLFYFNRVLAKVISLAIRTYTWHRYRIYIRIQAIQISLLAGRLFLKGVHYYGENETIVINDAFLTWRYWLRRVQDVDIRRFESATDYGGGTPTLDGEGSRDRPSRGEQGFHRKSHDMPCRFAFEIRGFEWYVYNRSAAYDAILASISDAANPVADVLADTENLETIGLEKRQSPATRSLSAGEKPSPSQCGSSSAGPRQETQENTETTASAFLRVLPIAVECDRGALVMGNDHTPCVIVAKFMKATGRVNARASGLRDQYRQSFDFDFVMPVVQMKPNRDYKETLISAGARSAEGQHSLSTPKTHEGQNVPLVWHALYERNRRIARRTLGKIIPYFRRSVESLLPGSAPGKQDLPFPQTATGLQNRWIGLTRYLEDDLEGTLEQERWKAIEYAQMETIVDCPLINMSFFWDIPGIVSLRDVTQGNPPFPDINGAEPPEWGLELKIHGGIINYGPWADRQRADIQAVFFPSSYTDAVPAMTLTSGESRVSTVFKIVVILEEKVVLRIHTKEQSKDWRWKGHPSTTNADVRNPIRKLKKAKGKKHDEPALSNETRSAGWLDVQVAANTCVSYAMDMIPRASGFTNKLEIELIAPRMLSSVNHDLLWCASSQIISCDISNPLCWNTQRDWRFDICSNNFELFILRDHVFLLTDLVNDWASGPAGELRSFVPFNYSLCLQFPDFKLNLNVNDSNIIDKPAIIDENAFLVIWADRLSANVGIPLDQYCPLANKVTFDVELGSAGLRTLTPTWATYHMLLESSDLADLKSLLVQGSYNYWSSTSYSLTDTVLLDIEGIGLNLYLYGYLIRYFINFKENYFGEDLHFQTLEEYQQKINRPVDSQAVKFDDSHTKLSNDLDVILAVKANGVCFELPSKLYSASESIKIDISLIALDLRFTNYYMDLQVSLSPSAVEHRFLKDPLVPSNTTVSGTQVFIDGLTISGHRLFGLPPAEPTYMCNWDFEVGKFTGETSLRFLASLISSLQCFMFTFNDAENALPRLTPLVIHDVTFLRVRVASIRLWLHVDHVALLCSVSTVKLDFNDWAGHRFSERLHLMITELILSAIDSRSASRHRSKVQQDVPTYAYLKTSIDVNMLESKASFKTEREMQQDHLALHDSRTQRTPWVIHDEGASASIKQHRQTIKPRPPAMPVPPMPEPLRAERTINYTGESLSNVSSPSIASTPKARRHTSFFSVGSISRSATGHPVDPTSDGVVKPSFTLRASGRHSRSSVENRSKPRPQSLVPAHLHSETGVTEQAPEGLPPSSMAYSSSYEVPYFPLQFVEPETDDVPAPPQEKESNDYPRDLSSTNILPKDDDGVVYTTFIIRIESGVRVLCSPTAVDSINSIISGLQARTPETLLDQVHIASMTDVLASRRQLLVPRSLQIRLDIPYVGVRFRSQDEPSDLSQSCNYCYDLRIAKFTGTGRSCTNRDDKKSTSLHIEMNQLNVVVRKTLKDGINDLAQLQLNLNSTTLSLVEDQSIDGEVHFQDLTILSSNKKVEYLASLVNHTMLLAEELGSRFRETDRNRIARIQYLLFNLVAGAHDLPDPPFLSTASYILRSTTNHPRGSDSWKMISRLHWIYRCLEPDQSRETLRYCMQESLIPPSHTEAQVISSFNQWRSWDLAHVRASSLMQHVYGRYLVTPTQTSDTDFYRTRLAVKMGALHLIINPGPEQNELGIEDLVVEISSIYSRIGTPHQFQELLFPVRRTAVQVLCIRSMVQINWEAFELVQWIVQQLNTNDKKADVPTRRDSMEISRDVEHHLHVILVVASNDFCLRTINLKTNVSTRNMSASLVASKGRSEAHLTSGLISSEACSVEISSQSKALIATSLYRPSIHASLADSRGGRAERKVWTLEALCNNLSADVIQDALCLLDVADSVLVDEVAQLHAFTRSMKQNQTKPMEAAKTSADPASVDPVFYVTLLLDRFDISATLFSSLRYRVDGKVVRSSLRPLANSESNHALDFDIKEHAHVFVSEERDTTREISRLAMPSLNGRLVVLTSEKRASVDVSVSMEQIDLDASSVHELFSTLSHSELSNFWGNVTRDYQVVKTNYENLSGLNNRPSGLEYTQDKGLAYFARFDIAGLVIMATTVRSTTSSARLIFKLGPMYMKISNEEPRTKTRLSFPEIYLQLSTIQLLLESLHGEKNRQCGDLVLTASLMGTSQRDDNGQLARAYHAKVEGLEMNVYTETAATIINILGYLQQRLKRLNLTEELQTLRAKRRRRAKSQIVASESPGIDGSSAASGDVAVALFTSVYTFEMQDSQISWRVGELTPISPSHNVEDLVLSIAKVDLSTRKGNAARLIIQSLQLQMVPIFQSVKARSSNSALLPEIIFNVAYLSTSKDRRLAFQAVGKALDLRLTSQFILPASDLQKSIALATRDLRKVIADWNETLTQRESQETSVLGDKKLSSVLVDADFAGAIVYVQGKNPYPLSSVKHNIPPTGRNPEYIRNGQFTHEHDSSSMSLHSPGIALKLEYRHSGLEEPSLNGEIKIHASDNVLHPTVVPLILEISSTIKQVVGERNAVQKAFQPEVPVTNATNGGVPKTAQTADPVAILGNCRLNLGLRICSQEFGLSCQPIAKVAAAARVEEIYITGNIVHAPDQGRFFAISAVFNKLQASLQHVYSRDSTGSFEVDSVNLSLMNSKHVSDVKGLSAILRVTPVKVTINAKQLHDFLLFREIWYPVEMRRSSEPVVIPMSEVHAQTQTQGFGVQRFQQVAAATAFPWNVAISVTELDIQADFGQAIGKTSFSMSDLWACSRKNSGSDQNLCLGLDRVGMISTGRMSGLVELRGLRLRSSIDFPDMPEGHLQTPLVQASIGFDEFRIKSAFDYQVFAVAELQSLDFIMYNVRDSSKDRIVATIEGTKAQAFCTATGAAHALALYQALQRFLQEKQAAYESSLKDIEIYMRRKSVQPTGKDQIPAKVDPKDETNMRNPDQLQVKVVVTLKAVNIGAYPRTFFDSQIFKLEALDALQRFHVIIEDDRLQTLLSMTLGQLRIALSSVTRSSESKTLGEVSIDQILSHSTGSRGGTILKVPRVVAIMRTWQIPGSKSIEYVFKSAFEGKVEVGWNYSRISFIRGMWDTHSRALVQRLGKPLPPSAVQITGGPQPDSERGDGSKRPSKQEQQEKITAVVSLPLSKYSYTSREPPIIETPQLRDMGEATPPLEWIGLHRERLPILTHQILIVPLLEFVKEVEDAYFTILGSS